MNFLAHFHLAWPDPGLLAGALEGDYYKGPLRGDLPEELERGVRLHRAIDAYTDAHPRIAQLRTELPPTLRRYAGILIDLSFDHFLSLHWQHFADLPLPQFSGHVYQSLAASEQHFSPAARDMLATLIEHDILNLYDEWRTVTTTAERIGGRFRRHNPFLDVRTQLTPLRGALESAFVDFYPQLQHFSREQTGTL